MKRQPRKLMPSLISLLIVVFAHLQLLDRRVFFSSFYERSYINCFIILLNAILHWFALFALINAILVKGKTRINHKRTNFYAVQQIVCVHMRGEGQRNE